MAWATPQFSRAQVDEAGETLVRDLEPEDTPNEILEQYWDAMNVVNNWRSSHSFPLNSLQVNLRHNAERVYDGSLIAQRIKRLAAIDAKLRKFSKLRLSQIQDIGGCRAVLRSVRDVDRVVDLFVSSRSKHKLHHPDDYIRAPRASGYRGVHLIYLYKSDSTKTAPWNDLRIEIQIRSRLQHAWAAAVETVGAFVRQALKSSEGDEAWLRFFSLMGSALAIREKSALVPATPVHEAELTRELREYAQRLNVEGRLRGYGTALRRIGGPIKSKGLRFFLLQLDVVARQITIRGYPAKARQQATDAYLDAERDIQGRAGAQAVLVSVDSITALHRAYPNYFADTQVFIEALSQAIA